MGLRVCVLFLDMPVYNSENHINLVLERFELKVILPKIPVPVLTLKANFRKLNAYR